MLHWMIGIFLVVQGIVRVAQAWDEMDRRVGFPKLINGVLNLVLGVMTATLL